MFKRFARDERGNFAVIAGLMAVVLIGSLGGALDLSAQWTDDGIVQRATDAAALAGAKALETGGETDAQEAIQIVGQANLPKDFPRIKFIGSIDNTAGTVTVEGEGMVEPFFLKLFAINQLPVGATSKSLIQRKSYIEFYFLLDVSESMNIAASEQDRKKLEDYTRLYYKDVNTGDPRPCAFACHTTEWKQTTTVYDLNKSAGARLRIDVLRAASKNMIEKILDVNNEPGALKSTKVATSIFSEDFLVKRTPTENVASATASIDESATFKSAHTNINESFNKFSDFVGKQGSGKTTNDPRKFAIIVTDGVRDEVNIWGGAFGHGQTGTVSTAACKAMKDRGIDVAILEIKYQKYVDDFGYFRDRVQSYYEKVSPTLDDCASPSLYYQALDSDQAESQLLKMVDDLLTVRRRLAG